ncbi:hypothetical protein Mal65_22320 [Crateriforma conspicua]|nr:hypothetical protein Mal65_22320 [Crateriforma conspicua]
MGAHTASRYGRLTRHLCFTAAAPVQTPVATTGAMSAFTEHAADQPHSCPSAGGPVPRFAAQSPFKLSHSTNL